MYNVADFCTVRRHFEQFFTLEDSAAGQFLTHIYEVVAGNLHSSLLPGRAGGAVAHETAVGVGW